MIQVHKQIENFETFDRFLGYHPESCLFFDIETTGFSADSSIVFLIGAIYLTEHGWQLSQYMTESIVEEKLLLETFFSLAHDYQTLLHFNGATFDIPYLTQKAQQHHLTQTLSSMKSIDLYQKFRPVRKFFSLERMNQTSLESFLRYRREDRLTGKHMIDLFSKYTASGDIGLRDLLLLHNHDDLLGMTKLLRLCMYLTLPEFLSEASVTDAAGKIAISKDNQQLKLYFTLSESIPVPFNLTVDDQYAVFIQERHGQILIPIIYHTLYYFFPDYKNYYYLPLEDQAIHKSIGAFVDKEHRINAKPQNCYTRKTSHFLPQPDHVFSPEFRYSYNDKQLYFECTDAIICEPSNLLEYAKQILKKII